MLFDGILETTTTTGTGDLTTSAVTGRPRFTDFFTANATEALADPFFYAITTQDSPPQLLEMGIGYCSAAGTLKRMQIIATYSGGAFAHFGTAATLPAGTKNVICSAEAASLLPAAPDIAALPSGGGNRRAVGPSHIWAAASSGATTKDRLYYTPIYLDVARRVLSLRAYMGGTAGAGGTRGCRLALYSALRTGGPGRKLIESGDLVASSFAEISYVFSAQRLPPGWYYGAFCHDYATTSPTMYLSSGTIGQGCGQSPLGWNTGNGPLHNHGAYETLTSGWTSLPAQASAAASLTALSSSTPMILLGVE